MMYDLTVAQPKVLADAVAALKKDSDARALGGGQTLIPTLKARLAQPSVLVALTQLTELQGISVTPTHVVIGAGVRHADVAANFQVAKKIPALAKLAGAIGDPQVRNRGTLGGSIANNDPAADYPAALVGLAATVHTSAREITADDFFTGMFSTALAADEIITRVAFPIVTAAAYVKIANPASRYALAGVFVARSDAGVRVAVTGAASAVFRWSAAEQVLAELFSVDALDGLLLAQDDLNTDMHASADYRAHLVAVALRRAVAELRLA
jgi:aerobic carbon-monoxide dehydrogenase medium subunit